MRILKNPNPVEEIEKECESCNCTFAFTEGDIKTYAYSNEVLGPGFYGYRKRYVLCPNCGKEIVLEEKSTSGRDSMMPSLMTVDIKELMKESENNITELGDIDDLIEVFPHLTEPDEDGE